MAPSVNLSDDIAELSRCVAQLFRLLITVPAGTIEGPAAAAGLSVAQAVQFTSGMVVLPPRQSITFANAILERSRASHASHMTLLRQPRLNPDPAEATIEGCQAAVDKLNEDYPAWTIALPAGHKSIGAEKPPRLVWRAVRDDEMFADCHAGTVWELRSKLDDAEAALERDARKIADYNSGRGVRGTRVR